MKKNKILKDLIYFDFSKAVSIWSQIEEGLTEKVSISEETQTQVDAGGSLGIPKIAEAKLGSMDLEKKSILETKVLHHDLLNRLETRLTEFELVANLNNNLNPESVDEIRNTISAKPYVLAEGWSTVEDYQRLENLTEQFNDLTEFISNCSLKTIKDSEDYQTIQSQIEDFKKNVKLEKDRNKRSVMQTQVNSLELKIKKILTPPVNKVDKWLLEGIKLWITNFSPNRIQLRIYPFENHSSFSIIGNLKHECFVDSDVEHLLFGYGYKPNIKLSIFGLITSIPTKESSKFLPFKEFEEMPNPDEKMVFEKAFRGMFSAMEGIEEFMRFSRYPNIILHPIAVFRNIIIN